MTETRNINTGGGQYVERVEGNYIQGNVITNNLPGATVGNLANQLQDNASQTQQTEQHQSLAEAAQEIQALLDQLSQTYPTATPEQLAQSALTQIHSNSTLTQRILEALEAGTLAAISQFLNHPAAAFVIEATQTWNDSKVTP
jgi:hypothetical protein